MSRYEKDLSKVIASAARAPMPKKARELESSLIKLKNYFEEITKVQDIEGFLAKKGVSLKELSTIMAKIKSGAAWIQDAKDFNRRLKLLSVSDVFHEKEMRAAGINSFKKAQEFSQEIGRKARHETEGWANFTSAPEGGSKIEIEDFLSKEKIGRALDVYFDGNLDKFNKFKKNMRGWLGRDASPNEFIAALELERKGQVWRKHFPKHVGPKVKRGIISTEAPPEDMYWHKASKSWQPKNANPQSYKSILPSTEAERQQAILSARAKKALEDAQRSLDRIIEEAEKIQFMGGKYQKATVEVKSTNLPDLPKASVTKPRKPKGPKIPKVSDQKDPKFPVPNTGKKLKVEPDEVKNPEYDWYNQPEDKEFKYKKIEMTEKEKEAMEKIKELEKKYRIKSD
jgi:hypothetical protein